MTEVAKTIAMRASDIYLSNFLKFNLMIVENKIPESNGYWDQRIKVSYIKRKFQKNLKAYTS